MEAYRARHCARLDTVHQVLTILLVVNFCVIKIFFGLNQLCRRFYAVDVRYC